MDCAKSSTLTCTCRRFIALSCRRCFGGIADGGRARDAAPATIFGKVGEQLVHRAIFGRIDELTTEPALSKKAGMQKLLEMERQRCRQHPKPLGDNAGPQTGRSLCHQQAERIEAGLLGECAERGNRVLLVHAPFGPSILMIIKSSSDRESQ